MVLTKFQEYMDRERWTVINKFQEDNPTSKDKEAALKKMDDRDIEFLIYCCDNIYGCMFYSKFLSKYSKD